MSDWDVVDILEAMGHDPVDPPSDALRVVAAIERARSASGRVVEGRALAIEANQWIAELELDCKPLLIDASPKSKPTAPWPSGAELPLMMLAMRGLGRRK